MIVAVVVLVAILLMLWRKGPERPASVVEELGAVTPAVSLLPGSEPLPEGAAEAVATEMEEKEPPSKQQVFRLQLDGDRCVLEALDEVSGHFGRERSMEWLPGMLCCRLISAEGKVLDERTVPAPDRVCVVIDPNVPNAANTAVRMTPEGPSIFQVRFPDLGGAARLEVSRIGSIQRPTDAAALPGTLLASIEIPRR